jgi:long-chain acyl-CoA synthetase
MRQNKPERLFDCIAYQMEKFPKPDMLAAKENGRGGNTSTREVVDTVDALAIGLTSLGVSEMTGVDQQDKIALVSYNRAEWLITTSLFRNWCRSCSYLPNNQNSEIEFIFRD